MLPVASNGDRPRSALEKHISRAVFTSILGPGLGAGSAVTTREALVARGGLCRQPPGTGYGRGCDGSGCGDFGDTRAVEA